MQRVKFSSMYWIFAINYQIKKTKGVFMNSHFIEVTSCGMTQLINVNQIKKITKLGSGGGCIVFDGTIDCRIYEPEFTRVYLLIKNMNDIAALQQEIVALRTHISLTPGGQEYLATREHFNKMTF